MTKKSESRVRRDQLAAAAAAEGIKDPYQQLEGMYQKQLAMFKGYHEMAKLVIMPEVMPFLKDPSKTNSVLRTAKAEIVSLHQQTEALHDTHKHKLGTKLNPGDEDEHFNVIMQMQQYEMFLGIHIQNITPLMLEIDNHLNEALAIKQAAVAAAATAPANAIEQAQPTADTAEATQPVETAEAVAQQ